MPSGTLTCGKRVIHLHTILTALQHASAKMGTETMTPKLITEIDLLDSCRHTRYFKFLLPYAHKDGYRQVTSYNAFFNSDREKNYRIEENDPTRTRTHVYHQQDDTPVGPNKVPGLQVIDVLDIFDFYKLIGFDYKQRIWLTR